MLLFSFWNGSRSGEVTTYFSNVSCKCHLGCRDQGRASLWAIWPHAGTPSCSLFSRLSLWGVSHSFSLTICSPVTHASMLLDWGNSKIGKGYWSTHPHLAWIQSDVWPSYSGCQSREALPPILMAGQHASSIFLLMLCSALLLYAYRNTLPGPLQTINGDQSKRKADGTVNSLTTRIHPCRQRAIPISNECVISRINEPYWMQYAAAKV